MNLLQSPASFRVRELSSAALTTFTKRRMVPPDVLAEQLPFVATVATNSTMAAMGFAQAQGAHPNFIHLAGLVCEAVLEVVFVALPGFLVAVTGMFDASSQKFVAELNTMVFTPCLVFTKLASQLNADKLADLMVIPFIFAVQTLVSWLCAQGMAKAWGFGKKEKQMQKNFILAMGVFGNSNSLPISLVISLSKTISGLHWDQIPGDNDDEVAARGILYLLIFQQLGQLLRWTWGYSVLLKPKSAYEQDESSEESDEDRLIEEGSYRDDPNSPHSNNKPGAHGNDSGFSSGSATPNGTATPNGEEHRPNVVPATPAQGNNITNEPHEVASRSSEHTLGDRSRSLGHITVFPSFSNLVKKPSQKDGNGFTFKEPLYQTKNWIIRLAKQIASTTSTFFHNLFRRLPSPVQKSLSSIHYYNCKFWAGVWRQMNPPLWAMLAALIVASIPALQKLFFTPGTLVSNSVTRAIQQSGSVAVPLILVVLGANLARSTLPQDQLATTPEEKAEERKLLYASLLSRMVLPTIIMAPLLALTAKFVPVSILDDPIFIIVCFLLTGAPSALQLAQICQINGVFMGAMSNLLTASYVVMIFPSTLLLVMLALEVVQWAVV